MTVQRDNTDKSVLSLRNFHCPHLLLSTVAVGRPPLLINISCLWGT